MAQYLQYKTYYVKCGLTPGQFSNERVAVFIDVNDLKHSVFTTEYIESKDNTGIAVLVIENIGEKATINFHNDGFYETAEVLQSEIFSQGEGNEPAA